MKTRMLQAKQDMQRAAQVCALVGGIIVPKQPVLIDIDGRHIAEREHKYN